MNKIKIFSIVGLILSAALLVSLFFPVEVGTNTVLPYAIMITGMWVYVAIPLHIIFGVIWGIMSLVIFIGYVKKASKGAFSEKDATSKRGKRICVAEAVFAVINLIILLFIDDLEVFIPLCVVGAISAVALAVVFKITKKLIRKEVISHLNQNNGGNSLDGIVEAVESAPVEE